MKKKLCFTLILLVFLFSTKDVFASRDALLLLKDKINESNYIEKIIELNHGEDYSEDIKVNANSYGNSIKLDLVNIRFGINRRELTTFLNFMSTVILRAIS